jgi:DMSO/TMAO reductase YedYZ molybdopterin-dependent catalytic subunit
VGTIGALAIAVCAWGADTATDAVSVEGNIGKPRSWTAEQIKAELAQEVRTITFTAKDGKHSATAAPLLALVNAGGVQIDPKIKNHVLRFVVVVEGRDGYMATFALAELEADLGNREAWVIVDTDGKALSERDGPASLVVPGDQKAGRWVHGIKRVRVVDMSGKGDAGGTRP